LSGSIDALARFVVPSRSNEVVRMDARMRLQCPDDPAEVYERSVCLHAVSKDAKGDLRLLERKDDECPQDRCRTLKTIHLLYLAVDPSGPEQGCDSEEGAALNGRFYVRDLVHAFSDGDPTRRGFHAGTFRWTGSGAAASGRISGITNAGTHRKDPFEPCQHCHAPGWMEGRFCGTIDRAVDQHLVGCELIGTYRFRLDPQAFEQGGDVVGTLEGLIVCACTRTVCVDFQGFTPGSGPNPRTEQGVTFTVRDHLGNPTPTTEIQAAGGFTGLQCSYLTEVGLPTPSVSVEATLVRFAAPATVQAFSGGVPGAITSMTVAQGVAETLVVTGTAIDQVVITAPNDEVQLLRLCYQPAPR
jgi:hypothetical protein